MIPRLNSLKPYPYLAFFFCFIWQGLLFAQDECVITDSLDQGYSVSLTSVAENPDESYTIMFTVESTGCEGCERLNRIFFDTDPGTYSNLAYELVSNGLPAETILFGPDLGPEVPFEGFGVLNTNGLNNENGAAIFTVEYTLTGGFQEQLILLQGSDSEVELEASFSVADFEEILVCSADDIVPYYQPPEGGKSFDIIGAELTFLYDTFLETGDFVSDDIFQIIEDRVIVSIITQPGEFTNALNTLTGVDYGLLVFSENPALREIQGQIPILNLLSLNELPELLISVRPVYPALSNAGLIVSQGDTAMRSFIARDVFMVEGSGVKVGVLSDSYNTILGNPEGDDIQRGDLPGPANEDYPTPVDVVGDYPFGSLSDEGRAMLQIIHDVAPGAELAFRTGFLGAGDFAQGILELQEAGCDVIVDDITYISEPFFRDGTVAQAVDSATALGVSYFSAAGNFGTRSWEGTFAPVAAPGGIEGEAHNFAAGEGGSDIYQNVGLTAGNYTLVMQWDDGTPGLFTQSDFDVYLTDSDGETLFGFNSVNTGGQPIEVLPFTVLSDNSESNLLITRAAGSGPVTLKYIVFRGNLTVNEYANPNASTLVGQANSEGAMAVGAVLYLNTPEFGVNPPTIASFSSRGGTPVNGEDRMKPEFCGPNGVNTSVDLGGFDIDGDAFPNFFGTSAAAPHAAGLAALVIEARQKYYDEALSPEDLKAILQETAIDMESPGYDVASGAGYLLADSALASLANPSPFLQGLSFNENLIPGQDTIEITIFGEYLREGSQVTFNGEPIEGATTLLGDTAVVAVIPPFEGLYPEIQVLNPPLEGTNGSDGGLSNPLYFTTKEIILVEIADETKLYGEVLPEFSALFSLESLTGESLPLDSANLTQAELDRILGISFTTIANPLSNVGFWGIEANPDDPLIAANGLEASDPIDVSLLERFDFVVRDGLMEVFPLELLITPRDTTFIYNDTIVGITFDYVFNENPITSVNISDADSLAILADLLTNHTDVLVNRTTALVRGTALVNELGESLLTDSVLTNKTFLVSSTTRESRGTALVNGELIDPALILEVSDLSSTTRASRGTALVNVYDLVRGTALVNELDTNGTIINSTPLTNSTSIVNSESTVNSSTVTDNSNREAIVILVEEDIAILSGDSIGEVELESINLVTGDEVGTHIIAPGAFLSNNFNVRYGLGELTVLVDTVEIAIDQASLTTVYNGEPQGVAVSTVPDSVEFAITYDGDSALPINAGSYAVEVSIVDSNYVGETASATFVIQPDTAEITFVETSLNRVFNGSPKVAEVTTDPEGLDVSITYDGDSIPPSEAGSYEVVATSLNPNFYASVIDTLNIYTGEILVSIDQESLSKVYNGMRQPVSVTTTPPGIATIVTYRGDTLAPINADSYTVVARIVVGDSLIAITSDDLVIAPASATVSVGIESINQGEELAGFDLSFNGFVNGENESVVDSIAFETSPPYLGDPGEYELIPLAFDNNYSFESLSGTLYVNPSGEGTLPVIPKFLCYEVLDEPDADGFEFVAYYRHINNNSVGVYIPIGPKNTFFNAEFDNSEQPEFFPPGKSIIAIPFNGTPIRWRIQSNFNDSIITLIAKPKNRLCPTNDGNKSLTGADLNLAEEARVYPNPSSGRVFIEWTSSEDDLINIEVYDITGRKHTLSTAKSGVGMQELDFSGMSPGLYILRLSIGDRVETHSVVIR